MLLLFAATKLNTNAQRIRVMPQKIEIEDNDPNLIASFARGLSVIECFDGSQGKLTTADVSKATGLERATARRCLLTLVHLGYAEYDGKFFSLRPRLLRLGFAYLSSVSLPTLVQPFLDQLSEATQETCSVAVLDGVEAVYVARAHRPGLIYGLRVGSRLPAYASSMGRVLLANLPAIQARQLLQGMKRKKLTSKTKTSVHALSKELERIKTQGYALIDEELENGLRSIAIPIFDANNNVVAALNVGTSASRSSIKIILSQLLPQMLKIQAELSLLLR